LLHSFSLLTVVVYNIPAAKHSNYNKKGKREGLWSLICHCVYTYIKYIVYTVSHKKCHTGVLSDFSHFSTNETGMNTPQYSPVTYWLDDFITAWHIACHEILLYRVFS